MTTLINGIDLSDFQISNSLPASISFIIRKAGEGLGTAGASRCDQDIALAKKLGRDCAVYHFVHPSKDGAAQARLAIAAAKRNGVHGVACDCEVSDGDTWAQLEATMRLFLLTIKNAGLATLIYDDQSWVATIGAESWGYPIWLADPSHANPQLACVCHQYGTGPISGVGQCDLDRWVGNQASYDLFFHGVKPKPKPQPKPKPIPVPPLTADQYAAKHGMVQIDIVEARQAIAKGISYYVWAKGLVRRTYKMIPSRSRNIPKGVTLYAFKASLDAHQIRHAGA